MSLSRGARACLKYLQSRLGGKDHCWPSQYTIAADLRCSRRSVIRYIRELRDAKIVTSARSNRNTSYVYTLRADLAHRLSHRVVTSNVAHLLMNSEDLRTMKRPHPSESLNPDEAADLEAFICAHEARFAATLSTQGIPRRPPASQGSFLWREKTSQ
jgi:Helix-turn-helix domain